MKRSIALFAAAVSLVGLGAVAAAPAAKTNAVLVPAADVKWADVPNVPEVKMGVVEGDHTKGAHHAFHKFAAGFTSPVHHHSSDHHVTVVSGNLTLIVDGAETKLGPGSYFSFTKKQPHQTRCEAGADCLLFVASKNKWDVVVKEEKKADAAAPAKK